MAKQIDPLKIPRKKAGNGLEAAYLNGIWDSIETSANDLLDNQNLFQVTVDHRMQGLVSNIPDPETGELLYATHLDPDYFGIRNVNNEFSVITTDAANPELKGVTDDTTDKFSDAIIYIKNKLDNRINNLPNDPIMDDIEAEIAARISQVDTLQDFARNTLRGLMMQEGLMTYDFRFETALTEPPRTIYAGNTSFWQPYETNLYNWFTPGKSYYVDFAKPAIQEVMPTPIDENDLSAYEWLVGHIDYVKADKGKLVRIPWE